MEMCGVRACKIHRGRAVKQRRGRLPGQKATLSSVIHINTGIERIRTQPLSRNIPMDVVFPTDSLSRLPCRESLLLRSMRSARVDSALSCKFNAKIRAARDFSNATCPTIARARRTLHASFSISSFRYHHRDVD